MPVRVMAYSDDDAGSLDILKLRIWKAASECLRAGYGREWRGGVLGLECSYHRTRIHLKPA